MLRYDNALSRLLRTPMRVMLIVPALFISASAIAQNRGLPPPPPGAGAYKCVYSKRYSDSIRLSFYPFSAYPTVKLVSFRYHKGNLPVKENRVNEDSLIEKVTLSKNDILALTDVLYNNYLQADVPPRTFLCIFTPRNAILFFDSRNQLKGFVTLCFHCGNFKKSNEKIYTGENCTEKMDKLRRLFIEKGLRFGTNLNIERYPGETGVCCD